MSKSPLPPVSSTLDDVNHAGRLAARVLSRFAPLSNLQRAWLTGFLTELLESGPTAPSPSRAERAESSRPVEAPNARLPRAVHQAEDVWHITNAGPPATGFPNSDFSIYPASHHYTAANYTSLPSYTADNPFGARVLAINPIRDHEPNVWRVTLDITASGMSARPGAMIGVIPTNDAELVRDILARFKGAGQHSVTTSRGSGPAWRALLEECNLTRVTEPLLRLLAASTQRHSEATELERLIATGEHQTSVLGLLRRFPGAKPNISDFVARLAPLTPQMFLAASAGAKSNTQIDAVVGRNPDDSRSIVGQLAHGKLHPGEWLPVFMDLRPDAHPPEDPNAPVILIAPGLAAGWANTFLAERAVARSSGRNWLFTCPPPGETSVLYADALASWQSNRTLTRLDVTSPDELLGRIAEHGEMIQAWLLDNSHLYLFGSAQECGQLVTALGGLLAAHLKLSANEAEQRITEMRFKGMLRVVYTE